MLNFTYQDGIYNEDYNWLLDMKLSNCICKHVMSLQTDKTKSVYMESKKIGYDNVMWGYRSKIWKEEEHNRIVQLFNITKMIYKGYNGACRVIIGENGVVWLDNLHTAIKNIIMLGDNVKIKDINFYIVDMRVDPCILISINNSIRLNKEDIKGCIEVSKKRLNYVSQEICNINYTILEFMKDNNITKESIILK